MYHIEKAHYIVNEMVSNGYIVENNKANSLNQVALMDKLESDEGSEQVKELSTCTRPRACHL